MKHFNRYDSSNHSSIILEISRKNLVGKTKVQSPARLDRSRQYNADAKSSGIDVEKFIYNDELVVKVPVNSSSKHHISTIEFDGVLYTLIQLVKRQYHGNVNLQVVTRAVQQAIDKTNIRVDCDCEDWKYRYRYWATKYGYAYGQAETRPAKITNPNDNIGAMCKHLTAILNNKRWLVKLSSVINNIIKDNIEAIREAYGLKEEDFYLQQSGVNLRYKNKDNPDRNVETDKEDDIWDT